MRLFFGRLGDSLRSSAAPAPPSAKWVVTAAPGAVLLGDFLDRRDVDVVVAGEHVDGDHGGHAVDLHVLELLAQVGAALMDLVGVGGQQRFGQRSTGDDLVLARVGLEAAHGGDKNGGVGGQARSSGT